jgi:hypothetical protein
VGLYLVDSEFMGNTGEFSECLVLKSKPRIGTEERNNEEKLMSRVQEPPVS